MTGAGPKSGLADRAWPGQLSGMTEAKPNLPPPAVTARHLMRGCATATLATLGGSGWPYGSLVLVAADHDASPILLLSTLAEHTKNLLADSRVSLLFDGTAGLAEPLTGARVTVLGRATKTTDPGARAGCPPGIATRPSRTL